MKTVFEETYNNWKKLSGFFWGDIFDFRFFISIELSKIKTKSVLDLGCSVGVNLNLVDATEKIGIDINIESLKNGKIIYPNIQFIAASAENLPFKNNVFEQIISIHTLDTSLNEKNTINEIKRTTNSDSQVFLTGNWYHEKTFDKESLKEKIFGEWINQLKEDFQCNTIWYVRPNLKKINLKIKRKIILKSPKYFFKIFDMDKILKNMYKESKNPLEREPYIVKGKRK